MLTAFRLTYADVLGNEQLDAPSAGSLEDVKKNIVSSTNLLNVADKRVLGNPFDDSE